MGSRPLEVNVADLRKQLGQRLEVAINTKLEPLKVVSTQSTDAPVVGELILESIERGVSVVGAVRFGWRGECRRCLELLEGTSEAEIAEIYQYQAAENSEMIDFDGEHVDLQVPVRDAVMASLPLSPLCSETCEGPDPRRYPALSPEALEAKANSDKGPDPRWAALEGLKLE